VATEALGEEVTLKSLNESTVQRLSNSSVFGSSTEQDYDAQIMSSVADSILVDDDPVRRFLCNDIPDLT